MELIKNIFFNTDKLIQKSKVKISYTGKFFQDNSEEVYIHYGYGLLWENVSELKMEKTELGFQAEIELLEGDTFNFCFKNEKNQWDNNDGANYIFELEKETPEKAETDLIKLDDYESYIAPRRLKKSYIWVKKISLTFYKIFNTLPKLFSSKPKDIYDK